VSTTTLLQRLQTSYGLGSNVVATVYGDDIQIYGFSDRSVVDALQERLSVCINEIFFWMMSNQLQLNPTKTEVL